MNTTTDTATSRPPAPRPQTRFCARWTGDALVGVLAAIALAASEAAASESAADWRGADRPVQLDAVVVEGQRQTFRVDTSSSALNVEAPLAETPATVNALTGDFLDTLAVRGLEEAVAYLPGAGVENAGDPFSPKFNLRGFSVNSLTSGGVYVDGYQAVRRGYHFDRSLYERVDTLKGASAVLYGLATPGGVVNYTMKKPTFEASSYQWSAAIGRYDLRRASLDATGPLNDSKTLGYRLIATTQTANQTVNGENSDLSFDEKTIISPSLSWKTPSGGLLYANFEYSKTESVFDSGIKRLNNGEFLFDTDPYVGPASGFEREFRTGRIEFVQPLSENWHLLLGGVLARSDNVFQYRRCFLWKSRRPTHATLDRQEC